MARYALIIDQMQCHEQCTSSNTDRERPGSDHCQQEGHADHGSTKAGNNLAAHRTASKLNDADGQDQRCNAIELGVAVRQRSEQHENTAKYGADEADANALGRGGSACWLQWYVCARIWQSEQAVRGMRRRLLERHATFDTEARISRAYAVAIRTDDHGYSHRSTFSSCTLN